MNNCPTNKYYNNYENGFCVEKIKILFDWKDLPIQKELLDMLKISGTIFPHNALYLYIGNNKILIDATWPLKLKKIGFPVTENWNGTSDTNSITTKKNQIYTLSEFELKKSDLNLKRDELINFANKLNLFLGNN